jgi:hypothetical protein
MRLICDNHIYPNAFLIAYMGNAVPLHIVTGSCCSAIIFEEIKRAYRVVDEKEFGSLLGVT